MKSDEITHVKSNLQLSSKRSVRAAAYLYTSKYIYFTKVNSKYFIYFTYFFSKSESKVPPPIPNTFDVLTLTSKNVEMIVNYHSIEENSALPNTLFLSFQSARF